MEADSKHPPIKTFSMKAILTPVLVGFIACSAFAQYNSKNLSIPAKTENSYTYEHLRIYPIYAAPEFLETFKDVGKYMTLSKALEEKRVIITEAVDSTPVIRNNQHSNQIIINFLIFY